MPLSLLVLGKADKEQLGVPPQAPARCRRGALSPHRPGVSVGLWRVGAGLGSPCPGRAAACSCRQGCCLPRGYSGEIPSLKGEPHFSCSSFPWLVDWGLGVERRCFRVSANISDLTAFCKLGGFCVDLSPHRQPEEQLSGAGGYGVH